MKNINKLKDGINNKFKSMKLRKNLIFKLLWIGLKFSLILQIRILLINYSIKLILIKIQCLI